MKSGRVVIIGLDGVPFSMIEKFAQTGVMPNIGRLSQDGFFAPIDAAIPEVSCVCWSSIITGKNPAEHGIFGFIDLHPGSYKIRFPNFTDLRAIPFWKRCAGKSVIINVPSTYPVHQMNGIHISGFVSVEFEKSVYPASLIPSLRKLGYKLDVDAQLAHRSTDLFLEDLDKTLEARIMAYQYLWQAEDWQTFMLVFTATDRLMHFLWSAYEDENHKNHDDFLNHFRRIDQVIGDICSKLNEDDSLIILSDHGFEKLETNVFVNQLLAAEGFLAFDPADERKPVNISTAAKAFALDPARIYVNEKGKYPAGSLNAKNKQRCLNDLENLFSSFEIDGKKVFEHVYRKEAVYSGPYLDQVPDLVLIGAAGFNLKSDFAARQLTGTGPFTGKHTYHGAFLLTKNVDLLSSADGQLSVVDAGKVIQRIVCDD